GFVFSNDQLRRSTPAFPISCTMKLAGLSAGQIRYYDSFSLIVPERSEGYHRLFSMNDLDVLLNIRNYMEKGFTMKRIGEILNDSQTYDTPEVLKHREHQRPLLNRGDLSRFFNN